MPRSPEQFNDIRKQKKQLIMDTALELFAENGFHATSISQIAAKAKFRKALPIITLKAKTRFLARSWIRDLTRSMRTSTSITTVL